MSGDLTEISFAKESCTLFSRLLFSYVRFLSDLASV